MNTGNSNRTDPEEIPSTEVINDQITQKTWNLAAAAALFVRLTTTAVSTGLNKVISYEDSAVESTDVQLPTSSTEFRRLSQKSTALLHSILRAASHEHIEDGVDNSINQRLQGLLFHDPAAVDALIAVIESENVTPIVAAEILKELGYFGKSVPSRAASWALEHFLNSKYAFVRDGAGLGLARLNSPATIMTLTRAIEKEADPEVKADLQLVLDEISNYSANDFAVAES